MTTNDEGIPGVLQLLLNSLERRDNCDIAHLCTEKSIYVAEDPHGIRLSEGEAGIIAGLGEARNLLGETPQRVSTVRIDDDYWACTHLSLREGVIGMQVRSSVLLYNGLIAEVRQTFSAYSATNSGTA